MSNMKNSVKQEAETESSIARMKKMHKYLEEILKREPVKVHPGQISLEI